MAGALSASACALAQGAVPAPFAAEFEGRKTFGLVDARARAVLELRRSPTHARYTASATVSVLFMSRRFDDCSVVRVEAGRLLPLEYVHLDHGDAAQDVHTRFDWTARRAHTRLGSDREVVVELQAPTWDPLSFQLALAAAAASGQGVGGEAQGVVERGVLKTHRVDHAGTERSPFPDQAAEVFAVRTTKDGGGGSAMLLDPGHGWQPLRLVVGDVTLDRSAQRPPPPDLPANEVPRCPVRTNP